MSQVNKMAEIALVCKTIHEYLFYYMISVLKTHPVLKIINGSLVDLPTPANISSL